MVADGLLEVVEVLERPEGRLDRGVAAGGTADGVGLPGSFGPAASVLFGPLRLVIPIGWIGVRYRTSKPMARMAGSRRSASRNVALRFGSVP